MTLTITQEAKLTRAQMDKIHKARLEIANATEQERRAAERVKAAYEYHHALIRHFIEGGPEPLSKDHTKRGTR